MIYFPHHNFTILEMLLLKCKKKIYTLFEIVVSDFILPPNSNQKKCNFFVDTP